MPIVCQPQAGYFHVISVNCGHKCPRFFKKELRAPETKQCSYPESSARTQVQGSRLGTLLIVLHYGIRECLQELQWTQLKWSSQAKILFPKFCRVSQKLSKAVIYLIPTWQIRICQTFISKHLSSAIKIQVNTTHLMKVIVNCTSPHKLYLRTQRL